MKVVKNINNNVSICLDSKGVEVVAFGKGIGFTKPPYEVDLANVTKTYYNVDSTYVSMINDIPKEVIEISDEIVEYARSKLGTNLSSNIVFTLADHLAFAIQRVKKNIKFTLPIASDIQYLYEKEMEVGKFGTKLVLQRLKVYLPKDEAAYIALHIINSQEKEKNNLDTKNEELIDEIVKIIEEDFKIKINKDDFNYSRFVTHMHYLLKRGRKEELLQTDNSKLYEKLVKEYPKAYASSEHVSEFLDEKLNMGLNEEEKLYLMLHINRLCTREDCYQ